MSRLSPRLADLDRLPHGTLIELAVQSLSYQRPPTAKGTTFIAVSDESGLGNVVVPLSVYDRDRAAIRGEVLLWVRGIVERRGTATTIRARAVRPLATLLTGSEQREVRKKRPQPIEPPRPGEAHIRP
ncbi:MAG TPA: hypothetical protein VNL35_16665 [Chloroflexota bacterium]|nr:hypothetical protein [Chloroflexota bacterium]